MPLQVFWMLCNVKPLCNSYSCFAEIVSGLKGDCYLNTGGFCSRSIGKSYLRAALSLACSPHQQGSGQDQTSGSIFHWDPGYCWIRDFWGIPTSLLPSALLSLNIKVHRVPAGYHDRWAGVAPAILVRWVAKPRFMNLWIMPGRMPRSDKLGRPQLSREGQSRGMRKNFEGRLRHWSDKICPDTYWRQRSAQLQWVCRETDKILIS